MTPTPFTPAARALVGVLTLQDDPTKLDSAAKLAGYAVNTASPVFFHGCRCYRRAPGVRLVVRDGRAVRVALSDVALEGWLRRLGRKLAIHATRRVPS